MHFHPVRALEEACWTTCVRGEIKPGSDQPLAVRHLVRVLVEQETMWSIDHVGVEVERGLVVSFSREDDAAWFTTPASRKDAARAEPVWVVPGMIVAFHDVRDAEFFIRAGKAESMTETEFYAVVQQMQAGQQDVPQAEPVVDADPEPVAAVPSEPAPKAKSRKAK